MHPRWSIAVFAGLAIVAIGAVSLSGGGLRSALIAGGGLLPTRVEGATFPKQLVDPMGVSHRIDAPPRRIVSTMLAADEMLSALVDPGRVVGVTYLVDDPRQSNAVGFFPAETVRIGTQIEPLLALEPDLVFVASFTRAETVSLLLSTGVPVVRLGGFRSFSDVEANLRLAAAATGREERAERLLREMGDRIEAVEARVAGHPRPRVLAWGTSGYTKGRDTLMDEIIERAGGINVMGETGLRGVTQISMELAIGLEPEVILMEEDGGGGVAAEWLTHSAWQHVPAVRDGRVYDHHGPWVSSVTPFRVRDLEEVARLLHPGAFTR